VWLVWGGEGCGVGWLAADGVCGGVFAILSKAKLFYINCVFYYKPNTFPNTFSAATLFSHSNILWI
jgi:hypothetical protein